MTANSPNTLVYVCMYMAIECIHRLGQEHKPLKMNCDECENVLLVYGMMRPR